MSNSVSIISSSTVFVGIKIKKPNMNGVRILLVVSCIGFCASIDRHEVGIRPAQISYRARPLDENIPPVMMSGVVR